MFKRSKKGIAFVLFLALGANSCSYAVIQDKPQKQQNIFQRTKNYIGGKLTWVKNKLQGAKNYVGEKLTWAKNKIVEHATVENVSLVISTGLIATVYAAAGYLLEKGNRLGYKKPSKAVKNCVTRIAQRLKIKNPEKIRINIDEEAFSDASSLFGSIQLSRETASNINSDSSKFTIGHELSHHKHKDGLVSLFLRVSLFLLLAKYSRKIIGGGRDIPLFRTDDRNISIKRRLLALGSLVFVDIISIFGFACGFILNNTFGKYYETRADIESASLGKDFVNGGIDNTKKYCLMFNKKFYLVEKILKHFLNPHFLPSVRLKYLNWYKKWKYGQV